MAQNSMSEYDKAEQLEHAMMRPTVALRDSQGNVRAVVSRKTLFENRGAMMLSGILIVLASWAWIAYMLYLGFTGSIDFASMDSVDLFWYATMLGATFFGALGGFLYAGAGNALKIAYAKHDHNPWQGRAVRSIGKWMMFLCLIAALAMLILGLLEIGPWGSVIYSGPVAGQAAFWLGISFPVVAIIGGALLGHSIKGRDTVEERVKNLKAS